VESEPESKPVCGALVRRLRLRESRLASYVVGLEVFLACLVGAEASIELRETCFRDGCARCAVVLAMLAARAQELEVLHPSRLEKGEGVRSSSSNTRGYWRGLNFVFCFVVVVKKGKIHRAKHPSRPMHPLQASKEMYVWEASAGPQASSVRSRLHPSGGAARSRNATDRSSFLLLSRSSFD